MSDIRPGGNTQAQFFSKGNEVMLDRLLNADFQRRVGGDLSEKQKQRLDKTVRHYMTEAYAKNPSESIQFLNKEVLTSVVPDYMAYLRRSSGPALPEEETLRTDVNSRFSQLQNERQGVRATPPPPPDFQISLEADGPTPLSRFEEIKRIRDAEAAREAEAATARAMSVTSQELVLSPRDNSMSRFVDSDVDFKNSTKASDERDQLSLIMREAERQAARGDGRTEMVLPDPRRILLGDAMTLPPRAQGISNGNPTTALPDRIRDRPVLPQDVLKPQDDIVTYKEVEHNLFVYSADRDWVNNSTENRYNFSVVFDPANNQSGFGYNTATNVKFKNIVRVEFVKAIMPTESFDVLMTAASSGTVGQPTPGLNTSIFSFPYLQVRIPELNVNGYGTNDGINNAFAAISYDAYWTSDSNAANRGYARMIPKFLKCQKVYYPTPLATLQKLSFQIQRPDGSLVSSTSDTLTVSMILMPPTTAGTSIYEGTVSNSNTSATSSIAPVAGGSVTITMSASNLGYTVGSTVLVSNTTTTNTFLGIVSSYSGTSMVVNSIYNIVGSTFGSSTYTVATWGSEWIWLQTSTWFSQFMFSQGDRIVLKSLGFNTDILAYRGMQDVINYLTQPQGILISAIGRSTGAIDGYADGANTAGYANSIIIRNSFQDPTTGATTVSSWVPNYIASVGTLTKAASSTTVTPSSGTVTLTLATGLTYTAGMQVFVTGATTANNFTGVVSSYTTGTGAMVITSIANINGSFGSAVIYTVTAGTIPSAGRMINMNHQIQVIMRVITREMDSASKLRPDNLQA